MASIAYDEQALRDLERLAEFLANQEPQSAQSTIGLIVEAIEILANHPLVGRPIGEHSRELVISRGRTGYLALYEHVPARDRVQIRAIRHQREVGFEEDSIP